MRTKLLFIVFCLLFFTGVNACTCFLTNEPVSIRDYNSMPFILSGIAKDIIINDTATYDQQKLIVFEVKEVFKGNIKEKTIIISTAIGDWACGLFVQKGESWVIWAYMQNKKLTTSLCTRSIQTKYVSDVDIKTLRFLQTSPSQTEWKNAAGVKIAEGKLDNQKPVGYWKYYYKNGYIELEGGYVNELYSGRWIKYMDPEGIVTRLKYDKKIPQDSMPDLNRLSNKVFEIQQYKNGRRNGEFIHFSYTSIDKPYEINHYLDGKRHGKTIHYFEDGQIYYEQNFLNDQLDGFERFYHRNGQLYKEGKFVEGNPVGEFRMFDENGKLIKTAMNKRVE